MNQLMFTVVDKKNVDQIITWLQAIDGVEHAGRVFVDMVFNDRLYSFCCVEGPEEILQGIFQLLSADDRISEPYFPPERKTYR